MELVWTQLLNLEVHMYLTASFTCLHMAPVKDPVALNLKLGMTPCVLALVRVVPTRGLQNEQTVETRHSGVNNCHCPMGSAQTRDQVVIEGTGTRGNHNSWSRLDSQNRYCFQIFNNVETQIKYKQFNLFHWLLAIWTEIYHQTHLWVLEPWRVWTLLLNSAQVQAKPNP